MLQHDILLEKKLNFFSKTTRQNKKNVYTTPPPPNFLEICRQLLRHFTKISSRRAKAYFKEQTEKLFSKIIPDRESEVLNNNKFVQQIKTTNLQLINVQGCTFFSGCLKDWDNSIQKT